MKKFYAARSGWKWKETVGESGREVAKNRYYIFFSFTHCHQLHMYPVKLLKDG